MSGNVWEWTRSISKPYPYDAEDGREDQGVKGRRVLRGGSFSYYEANARCAFRSVYFIDYFDDLGFRGVVAASPFSPERS
jgi:formylglycine-generating enzyme required for sulfatase activity